MISLRVSNLRLGIEESESALGDRLASALGMRRDDIQRWRILRKSLDARDKDDLAFVYSTEVILPQEVATHLDRLRQRRPQLRVEPYVEVPFRLPPHGEEPLRHRPVVVGSGPAGLGAAYFLAEQGFQPIVLERGKKVRDRIHDVQAFDAGGAHDPESNYLFGEGGAGTFSDGKLTCRGSGPDVQRILQLFADCKGKPSVVYEQRPHLGSNRLPAVVKALRQSIERMGGTFHFSCRVDDLDVSDGMVRGVFTSSGYVETNVIVLAIGHSARDTYAMLHRRGVPMVFKPFQLGVRIEQPQDQVNRWKYGQARLEDRLGAADYAITTNTAAGVDVFSFCMCAGGYVMPSVSEPGYFCTNGMSMSKHDSPYANSGLVVTLGPEHVGSTEIFAGLELQRHYESLAYEAGRRNYLCPIQWASDFVDQRKRTSTPPSSYPRGVVLADVAALVPPVVARAVREALAVVDRRWHGRFLANATIVGPEARGSSPIRIVRDEVRRCSPGVNGLYPIGEGAGYAGGIISAAVDGMRTARALIQRFAPLR